MISPTTVPQDQQVARQTVARFVRQFGAPHRLLARIAALPLVLTPELLGYLRYRFLRGEVPWVAEADLLLSDLCRPAGYELYVMDSAIRAALLSEVRQDPEMGLGFMQEVARLLIQYVRHLATTNSFISRRELQTQQWAAMVYLDEHRETAVQELVVCQS